MQGITDSMRQYERTIEDIVRKNPKNSREYGVKRPDSAHIVVVVAAICAISIIIVDLMK